MKPVTKFAAVIAAVVCAVALAACGTPAIPSVPGFPNGLDGVEYFVTYNDAALTTLAVGTTLGKKADVFAIVTNSQTVKLPAEWLVTLPDLSTAGEKAFVFKFNGKEYTYNFIIADADGGGGGGGDDEIPETKPSDIFEKLNGNYTYTLTWYYSETATYIHTVKVAEKDFSVLKDDRIKDDQDIIHITRYEYLIRNWLTGEKAYYGRADYDPWSIIGEIAITPYTLAEDFGDIFDDSKYAYADGKFTVNTNFKLPSGSSSPTLPRIQDLMGYTVPNPNPLYAVVTEDDIILSFVDADGTTKLLELRIFNIGSTIITPLPQA
jgi:hypothetical protein